MIDEPITLKTLTPKDVYEDQKVLRQRFEEFKKEKAMKREIERVCIKRKDKQAKGEL